MIENKYNRIIKNHDDRMHKIATLERRQRWSELYNESVKLVEELARKEQEILELNNRINLIGSTL